VACRCKACRKRPTVDVPTVDQKVCSNCSGLKPASEFGRDKYSRDGLQGQCTPCRLGAMRHVVNVLVSEKRCAQAPRPLFGAEPGSAGRPALPLKRS
jgi:hypothetical protein